MALKNNHSHLKTNGAGEIFFSVPPAARGTLF